MLSASRTIVGTIGANHKSVIQISQLSVSNAFQTLFDVPDVQNPNSATMECVGMVDVYEKYLMKRRRNGSNYSAISARNVLRVLHVARRDAIVVVV